MSAMSQVTQATIIQWTRLILETRIGRWKSEVDIGSWKTPIYGSIEVQMYSVDRMETRISRRAIR
jgi:hypothetical protein